MDALRWSCAIPLKCIDYMGRHTRTFVLHQLTFTRQTVGQEILPNRAVLDLRIGL